jgi:hypothetical protein
MIFLVSREVFGGGVWAGCGGGWMLLILVRCLWLIELNLNLLIYGSGEVLWDGILLFLF